MMIHFQGKDIKIDKKYIIVGIILLLFVITLIILTKSIKTTNQLRCELTEKNETGTFSQVYNATFVNNKLNKLIIELENHPSEKYMYMINDIYTNYYNQLEEFKKNGGYEYVLNKEQDYVSFKTTIYLDSIPDTTKDAINFNENWNYEDFKKDLENVKFICN